MAVGKPAPTSPIEWRFPDYMNRAITIRATFNDNSRRITGVRVTRDPGCLYQTIYWDVGVDGTPNTSTRQATVPEGVTNLGGGQISALGLTFVEDLDAVNLTVGP